MKYNTTALLFFTTKKRATHPLLPPRAKRQAPKYIDVYNQHDRIPPTTQRLQVLEKNEGALLDKVCNFVKLDLSEEYVLIVIKITIFPKV